jgi:hypothetical protein
MPKILTDKDLLDIVRRAVDENEIDDGDSYMEFLEELAKLIANHFGGDVHSVNFSENSDRYEIAFLPNECLPEEGGVFEKYDQSVMWRDGKEMDLDDPKFEKER